MPYGFNEDKSKFDLDETLNELSTIIDKLTNDTLVHKATYSSSTVPWSDLNDTSIPTGMWYMNGVDLANQWKSGNKFYHFLNFKLSNNIRWQIIHPNTDKALWIRACNNGTWSTWGNLESYEYIQNYVKAQATDLVKMQTFSVTNQSFTKETGKAVNVSITIPSGYKLVGIVRVETTGVGSSCAFQNMSGNNANVFVYPFGNGTAAVRATALFIKNTFD